MNQVFCRACGKQVDSTAQFCPSCGANQGQTAAPTVAAPAVTPLFATTAPSAPPATAAGTAGSPAEQIDALIWQSRFALIDKAGGAKLPRLWSLPPKEILLIRWNLWAFLFGPFYYGFKGMLKKGLALSGIGLLGFFLSAVVFEAIGWDPEMLALVPAGVLAGSANASYYRRMKEGFTGWW